MAVRKLSQIAAAGAIVGTDTIVGVQGGTTDVQYTVTNMAAAILTAGNGVTAASTLTSGRIPMGDGARGLADTGAGTIGTSLAIGGATIGANALAVTGTANISAGLGIGATPTANEQINILNTQNDVTRIRVQNSSAGTAALAGLYVTNGTGGLALYAAGQNYSGVTGWAGHAVFSMDSTLSGIIFAANAATATIDFQTNSASRWIIGNTGNLTATTDNSWDIGATGATRPRTGYFGTSVLVQGTGDAASSTGGALQVAGGASVAKRFWIPAISASAGLQTAVLCQSSGGEMIADSVACLASSARFKTLLGNAESGALDKIIRVPVRKWQYKRDEGSVFPDNYYSEHIGPTAEDIEAIDSRLVGRDKEGKARSISTDQLLALAIQAIQEQQEQIEELKKKAA